MVHKKDRCPVCEEHGYTNGYCFHCGYDEFEIEEVDELDFDFEEELTKPFDPAEYDLEDDEL